MLDARWDAHYNAPSRFPAREGHARVPAGHFEPCGTATPTGEEPSLRLGQRVIAQCAQQKVGDLARQRVQGLEGVPGWVWDVRVYVWECGLEALRDFVSVQSTPGCLPGTSTTVTSLGRGWRPNDAVSVAVRFPRTVPLR